MAVSEWQTAVVHTGGQHLATGPKAKRKKLEPRAEGTDLWIGQMPGCAQGTASSSGPAGASTRPGPAWPRARRALGEAPGASQRGALGAPAGLLGRGALRRVPKALPGNRSQPRVLRLGGAGGRQPRPALREVEPGPAHSSRRPRAAPGAARVAAGSARVLGQRAARAAPPRAAGGTGEPAALPPPAAPPAPLRGRRPPAPRAQSSHVPVWEGPRSPPRPAARPPAVPPSREWFVPAPRRNLPLLLPPVPGADAAARDRPARDRPARDRAVREAQHAPPASTGALQERPPAARQVRSG